MSPRTRIKKGLIAVAAALLLAAVCEIALSNIGYFTYHRRGDSPVELTQATESSLALPDSEGFFLCSGCEQLDLTAKAPIHALRFSVLSPVQQPSFYEITFSLSFPGDETRFFTAVTERFAVSNKPAEYTVNIPAEFDHTAACLRIEGPADAMLLLENITANPTYHFNFYALRFAILAALFAAVSLSFAWGLFRVPFCVGKRSHRLFAAGITALCIGCALVFTLALHSGDTASVPYPLEKGVESYNPYIQQFDAFMKGQAALDYEPSEELLALENPYDKENRTGIHYLWDRALYDGKYYSYFGIGPILTVYAPYYAVTGALPADRTVTGIFTVLTALFWSLAVFAWVIVFKKKVSLPLLGLGTLAGLFSTGLFLLQRGKQPFYFVAVLGAAAFLCAFAFFALLAFAAKGKVGRRILFAAAGLCFGLGFLCRVNTMIPAAVMIATAVIVYVIKSVKSGIHLPRLLPDLGCLAVPVLISIGVAFVFNYIRFGSPLEFGATYQLTVSDISQNKVYLGGITPTLFHYFFQELRKEPIFPYIRLSTAKMADYGRAYTYTDSNIGLFRIPLFLALPLFGTAWIRRKNAYEAPLIATGTLSLFLTAFLDFCLGGVIFRYLGDISFSGALLCLGILFRLLQIPKLNNKALQHLWCIGQVAGLLLFAAAFIIGGAMAISTSANLLPLTPEGYTCLKALFAVT